MSYLVSGNNPAAIKTAERNNFTATAGQTTFTISQGYQVGDIDVFLNGVRLIDSDDYYATNSSTVVLTSGAAVGDSLVVVCYRPYQVTDFYTKSEQDTRYVNATGDTVNGALTINNGTNIGLTAQVTNSSAQLKLERLGGNAGAGYIGADDTYCFRAYNNALSTDGLRVDHNGRVTMPSQPAFQTVEASFSVPALTKKPVVSTTFFNTGSCYNTTTGRFTAPVAGVYHFDLVVTPSSATSSPAIWIRVNGGTDRYGICLAYNTSYNGATASACIKLNVNDYVEGIVEEWNNGTSLAIWSASFGGHLIG